MKKIFSVLSAFALFAWAGFAQPVKIACIGDSISEGFGLANSCVDSYSVLLGEMLGEGYEVKNFGITGKCVQRDSNDPYWKSGRMERIVAFDPDIIIIKLGTNDSKPQNWKGGEAFKKDYLDFLDAVSNPNKKQTVYLATAAWVRKDAIGITRRVVSEGVNPAVREMAKARGYKIIDFYSLLENHPDWYCDDIHPNELGAKMMAEFVYKFLTGKKKAPPTAKIRGKKGEYFGYDRYDFQFRWRDASLFLPKPAKSAKKPRFNKAEKAPKPVEWVLVPNKIKNDEFYKDFILKMLAEGRAVFSIDIESWLGNQNSVRWMELPCRHYAETMNFSEKFDIFCDGKSSFFAVNFAAAHPQNVRRLCMKAPVLDIVAWAKSEPLNMKCLKQEWKLDDEGVENFPSSPADNIKNLDPANVLLLPADASAAEAAKFLLKKGK
ncbi:MAG: hypothetical protein J6P03_04645 [Opitutales bacterium]|nr:hypothetical protein [Opitutales bacterium]